ncbi:hypothetical protein MKW92_010443 [Papaver armeniacum]|nr:hypothetical protein MKW92_010443 [Papaver armeniacum]
MKSVSVPYRDISVDVVDSKLDKQNFPNICRDLTNMKMFEDMVHTRLWLSNRQMVNLMRWSDDPNYPVFLLFDEDFDKFWEEAEPNDKGCIELQVSVINHEDEYDAVKLNQQVVTPQKKLSEYSIESPRRSSRLVAKMGNAVQQVGTSRKLSFVDYEYDAVKLKQSVVTRSYLNIQ